MIIIIVLAIGSSQASIGSYPKASNESSISGSYICTLHLQKIKLEGMKPIKNFTDLSWNCSDLLAKPSLPKFDVLSIDESKKLQVLDRTKALYGPRTQAYGETKYSKEKLQVLDRTKALYGPRTQAYGETNYLTEKLQVLDRTKALHGPRAQAYGETNYLTEKLQVLDRTKVLCGPRTQAYGETNYSIENYKLWTRPGRYMALRIYPEEEFPIDS
uniref:Uncharacterized protein n=1 Tax=Quercus lobata TaxID=97700 RepID=A0A7N2MBW0_QUELO